MRAWIGAASAIVGPAVGVALVSSIWGTWAVIDAAIIMLSMQRAIGEWAGRRL